MIKPNYLTCLSVINDIPMINISSLDSDEKGNYVIEKGVVDSKRQELNRFDKINQLFEQKQFYVKDQKGKKELEELVQKCGGQIVESIRASDVCIDRYGMVCMEGIKGQKQRRKR